MINDFRQDTGIVVRFIYMYFLKSLPFREAWRRIYEPKDVMSRGDLKRSKWGAGGGRGWGGTQVPLSW